MEKLLEHHSSEQHKDTTQEPGATFAASRPENSTFDPAKLTYDEECCECKTSYVDPKPENLVMFLHAYKYKVSSWEIHYTRKYRTMLKILHNLF